MSSSESQNLNPAEQKVGQEEVDLTITTLHGFCVGKLGFGLSKLAYRLV